MVLCVQKSCEQSVGTSSITLLLASRPRVLCAPFDSLKHIAGETWSRLSTVA